MSEKSIKVNSILNVLKTLSSIIFPLITFPYISRVLQPENVGKVNFGSSFVSYFSLIASLGITTYAIRECSAVRGDKKKLGEKASQIFSINVSTTIVAYVLLGLSLIFFQKLDSYRTLIIIQSNLACFKVLSEINPKYKYSYLAIGIIDGNIFQKAFFKVCKKIYYKKNNRARKHDYANYKFGKEIENIDYLLYLLS